MFLDGLFECYTLEPPAILYARIVDQVAQKPYAIPAGTYPWRKYMSPDHGFEVVLVENVPGFEGVEIHPGSLPQNTLGCTLVGMVEQQNFVGHSQEEFARLMAKLPASGTITYRDPANIPGKPAQQEPQSQVS